MSLYPWNFQTIKPQTWNFHKIVLQPLEFPWPKTKTYGRSTWFFLNHSWKFYFFFNWPLEIPHSFFQYLWKFHAFILPVWMFSRIAHSAKFLERLIMHSCSKCLVHPTRWVPGLSVWKILSICHSWGNLKYLIMYR